MDRVLRVVVGASGILFVSTGIGWWTVPSVVGAQFRMALLDGVGLSTQIGDLGAFFLTLGTCMLAGLTTGQRVWYYPAILLLGLAAIGRTLAWLFHGAALAYDLIAVEVVLAVVLFVASSRLPRSDTVEPAT